MKQFSLEEYLNNPSRKVVTRDGRKVRIICTDAKREFPIIALIEDDTIEHVRTFRKNGYFSVHDIDNSYDLFFAPEKHEGWVNVYKDGDHFYSSMDIFKTKKEAEALSCSSCIATVKVEWEK